MSNLVAVFAIHLEVTWVVKLFEIISSFDLICYCFLFLLGNTVGQWYNTSNVLISLLYILTIQITLSHMISLKSGIPFTKGPSSIGLLVTFSHHLGRKYGSPKVEKLINYVWQIEIIINDMGKEIIETPIRWLPTIYECLIKM